MNLADLARLPDTRLLKSSGRDGVGNVLLLVGKGDGAAVLKLYRRRRSALREELGELAARIFHRKRGISARVRHRTERETLALWAAHGFDVLRSFDRPLPEGIDGPALWIEYCTGRLLAGILQDADVDWEEKAGWLRRLGAESARRHRLAVELSDPRLIHEKGTVKHVFVWGGRLITFDFEGGFGRRFSLLEAMAEEMSGYLRSIAQATGDGFGDAMGAWIEGYGDVARLREVARWGIAGPSLYRWLKILADPWRRPVHGKIQVLRRLLERLSTP